MVDTRAGHLAGVESPLEVSRESAAADVAPDVHSPKISISGG
eukprot:CAMPEP_0170168752 /NCGR_PEP_ID=MMETSP0040_2-20121228/1702_1 /TAXON_ID=641309 /ORGANISM="Lotharella oceanica, Strain CCMP622" /LENGTH=41 /DNA_ID= /DNA_START= /DNA_END= /DNA_ORIENTATION=